MAKKTFLVNIDLSKNELQNAKLQNLATHPSVTINDAGFAYWNTTDQTAYFWTGTVWKSIETNVLLTSDIPVTLGGGKTLGKYTTGQTIPAIGKTLEAVIRDIALEYVYPTFSSFSISGQATTVEVGTTLSGSKTFTWGININSGTVLTIDLYDNTAASTLLSNTTHDGSQAQTITTVLLNADGSSQSWKGIAHDTGASPGNINSGNFTVISRYNRFWGPAASLITTPSDGAGNRTYALGLSSTFKTPGANTFTLVTGTTQNKFVVLLPPGITITSVTDTTNLNANLTSNYVLVDTVQINDNGGTARAYNRYECVVGVPYSASANHVIVTN